MSVLRDPGAAAESAGNGAASTGDLYAADTDRQSRFAAQGYDVFETLLPETLVEAAALDAARLFETLPPGSGAGLTVYGSSKSPLERMARIDHPHLASAAITALLRHPALGAAAAGLMGAEAVQAWYVHMSRKPPANGARAHIGWHQDGQYSGFLDGRFVTAWIPLTTIEAEDSPICYVPGSHRLGVIGGSGFSGEVSPDELKRRLLERSAIEWSETEVCARPGTVAIHDSLIIHGSRGNVGARPRLALTVHMRSEHNRVRAAPGRISMGQLRDPIASPVIHGARAHFGDLTDEGVDAC